MELVEGRKVDGNAWVDGWLVDASLMFQMCKASAQLQDTANNQPITLTESTQPSSIPVPHM